MGGITYTVFTFPTNGIQNGEPDGIALVAPNGTVVEFLSYEGSFVAASGPAQGLRSVDILVVELGAVGDSLQRDIATGKWFGPSRNTSGTANGMLPPAPAPGPISIPVTAPVPVSIPVAAPTVSVTLIHDIQGTGNPIVSPYFVTAEAIVTCLFTTDDALNGFWMQEEDSQIDANVNTSEGIYVLCGSNCPTSLKVGSLVRVSGRAGQSFTTTQIDASPAVPSSTVIIVSTGNPLPSPILLTLPAASSTLTFSTFMNVEGMLVTFPTKLFVSEFFELGRFGQIVLTESSVPFTFTQLNTPSDSGLAAANTVLETSRIVLDDDNDDSNDAISDGPDEPYFYPSPGGLSLTNKFRAGDTITDLTGVMQHAFGAWRIRPVTQMYNYTFIKANTEPSNPGSVGGSLRVASFNVLNFFTTLQTSTTGCGPTGALECRGANTLSELTRQTDKIVSALDKLNPDIAGLIELQNSASGAPIAALVASLNDVKGNGTYSFIRTGLIGSDAISVGIIYKPSVVQPINEFALLNSNVDPIFIDTLNRPVLTQTFEEISTGGRVTISVCHLKSKGSACAGDPDVLDGQGNCRNTRKNAATALVNYLAKDPTSSGNSKHLIIGDLNSYALEDSIKVLKDANFTDLGLAYLPDDYSYLFDGQRGTLDYALASASLLPQISGVTVWHINSDEVPLFDYNDEIQSTSESFFERESNTLVTNPLYAPNELRASDHDPILVGLNLLPPSSTAPTNAPTLSPTKKPTKAPTADPTLKPTKSPTQAPTGAPTKAPTKSPTESPTKAPTKSPTKAPTIAPINCNVSWRLFNSQNDSFVADLSNGTIVTTSPPCRRTNIEAVVPCGDSNNAVTIELYQNSARLQRRVEKVVPYFLFGNSGTNVNNGRIEPGTYRIRVEVNGVFTPSTTFTLLGPVCN